jgi:hypothetical protein
MDDTHSLLHGSKNLLALVDQELPPPESNVEPRWKFMPCKPLFYRKVSNSGYGGWFT